MRVVILYRPHSDYQGIAEDYARDYHQQHPDKELELVNLDEIDGAEMAKLYDVTRYPAILALREDGSMLKLWQDEHFPLLSEVDYYARQ
jgi:hypothetical protein